MNFAVHFKKSLGVSRSPVLALSFAIAIFAIFPSTPFVPNASAQQVGGPVVTVFPKFPGPFQNVTIRVNDFSRDPNAVNISWSLNGKTVQAGTGLKEYKFITGALGTVNNISINLGGTVRTVSIRPTSVDILWQSDSYTPPFYAGKALHSNQDPITFVAEPFFLNSKKERLDPNKLIYNWKYDGTVAVSSSGHGKKSFKINPSILLKPVEIEVEVSSTDGIYHSNARIVIQDTEPEVLAYENHPLYGIIFSKSLNGKDFVMAGSETKITAMPFYFSNQQKKTRRLLYNWKLNNSTVAEKSDEIVFRKPENVRQGSSLISLDIKNEQKFMQFSDASFNIKFTNEAGSASQAVF